MEAEISYERINFFLSLRRTDCGFSPDDKMVFTSISLRKGETDGKLLFYDRNTFEKLKEIRVSDSVSHVSLSAMQLPPLI